MNLAYARGPRLDLRPIDAADAPLFVRWLNDPDVTQYLARTLPLTLEEESGLLKARAGDKDNVILVMVVRDGNVPIGSAGLHHISGPDRRGIFGIQIGEPSYWNRGFGSEATELMLEIAFERLNLNRVELSVYDTNARALRVYERAGYRAEGVSRQARFLGGRYVDVRQMAILAEEWRMRKSLVAAGEVCQT
ncbi:MAG: GNAT family N-acetyltransferase [Planctomycetes bacterium]|nr:GNAT family N-acetyltransferase [Planctomycetota bacterium]